MKKKGCLKRIAAVILTVIMMLSMACVPAFAAANEAVNKDKTGVIMIMTGTKDLDGNVYGKVQAGTGFLINETTVVTCNHVVVLDSNDELETVHMDKKIQGLKIDPPISDFGYVVKL